jgi:molybdopterin synthase sulfur carrier subunit
VRLHILYFAWLRERLGVPEEDVDVPEDVANVAGLIAWMATRGTAFATAFGTKTIRCAVNQTFAGPDSTILPGDEVAFFPPVTGG